MGDIKNILYVGNLAVSFQRELFKFLKFYGKYYDMNFFHYYFQLGKSVDSLLRAIPKLIKFSTLINFASDAVFVEFLGNYAYFTALLNIFNKPIIVRCHRYELYEYWDRHKERIVKAADKSAMIICVSKAMKLRLLELMPWLRGKVYVVYNSVDPNKFSLSKRLFRNYKKNDEFVIGSLGNLVPVKGFEELIVVVSSLIKKGMKIKLKIGGDGPLLGKLRKLISRLNLQNSVYLEGYIPYSKVPEWYHTIDLFVLNSRIEGLPTVILEAMASGLPVIATKVGGIPEVLSNEWLYDVGDTTRLIDLINKVYNMSLSERRNIGIKNRQKIVELFNIRKNTRKILELIKERIRF